VLRRLLGRWAFPAPPIGFAVVFVVLPLALTIAVSFWTRVGLVVRPAFTFTSYEAFFAGARLLVFERSFLASIEATALSLLLAYPIALAPHHRGFDMNSLSIRTRRDFVRVGLASAAAAGAWAAFPETARAAGGTVNFRISLPSRSRRARRAPSCCSPCPFWSTTADARHGRVRLPGAACHGLRCTIPTEHRSERGAEQALTRHLKPRDEAAPYSYS
jgi:hypothetical protein